MPLEKEKTQQWMTNYRQKFLMLHKIKDQQLKKEKTFTKWQNPTKLLLTLDGKKI